MRNILLLLLIMVFGACSDDEQEFVNTELPDNAFSFKSMAGGAIMHYVLPENPGIVGIKVRYKDECGKDMLRVGSNTCDSVKLVGFNKAVNDIPAQVSFCYFDDRESQPFDVKFNTADSGPVSFIKSAQVLPNWGGFILRYNNPPEATGMAHVFYLGINPVTNLPDTILMNSFLLRETYGDEDVNYLIKQNIASPTVILRVEDFRGNMVDERAWENLKSYVMTKLPPEKFSFYCDNSIEDPIDKLGVEYLFDGDTKGLICFQFGNNKKCCSFLAGPNAAGEFAHPMYMDLKKNMIMASVRLYSMLRNEAGPYWADTGDGGKGSLCQYRNEDELPCEVTLYGLKDDGKVLTSYGDINDLTGWEQLGTFKQEKTLAYDERWCSYCWNSKTPKALNEKELKNAEAEYMEIMIPVNGQGEGYRYIKMVINDVFYYPSYVNTKKYVQFHELEVYTSKTN